MTSRSRRTSRRLLVVALALAACGGSAPEPSTTASDAVSVDTATAYTAVAVAQPGAIRGSVRFVGAAPPARRVAVPADARACGTTRLVRTVRLGPESGLADAVVSLTDVRRGAALAVPPDAPILDQRDCEFAPHVVLAAAGRPVRVRNGDPVTHNVHTVAFDNRSVNRTQPAGADPIELVFPLAEKVKVQCDLHPWMSAWIVVMDHPYHAVTDETGAFALANVPPGTYALEIWHAALGTRVESVTVAPHDTVRVHIELTEQS